MICQAPCQLLMGPKVVYRAVHPVVPIFFICSIASCCTSSPAENPYLKCYSLSSPWAIEDWVCSSSTRA